MQKFAEHAIKMTMDIYRRDDRGSITATVYWLSVIECACQSLELLEIFHKNGLSACLMGVAGKYLTVRAPNKQLENLCMSIFTLLKNHVFTHPDQAGCNQPFHSK
jgi:hypothetical protein